MRKSTVNQLMNIMDNPKLSVQEKTRLILQVFAKQKRVDAPLLRGLLRELGQDELANKLVVKGGDEG